MCLSEPVIKIDKNPMVWIYFNEFCAQQLKILSTIVETEGKDFAEQKWSSLPRLIFAVLLVFICSERFSQIRYMGVLEHKSCILLFRRFLILPLLLTRQTQRIEGS